MISYRRLFPALLPCLCLLAQERGSGQTLNASVSLDQSGTAWTYTLTNNEPFNSGNQITTFYLPIGWSVSDVVAPADWDVNTDGSHFILWANVGDPANDIAPGASLSGFSFSSDGPSGLVAYTLLSWDHTTQSAGPSGSGLVVAPVPEPGSLGLLIGMGVSGLRIFWRRHTPSRQATGKRPTPLSPSPPTVRSMGEIVDNDCEHGKARDEARG